MNPDTFLLLKGGHGRVAIGWPRLVVCDPQSRETGYFTRPHSLDPALDRYLRPAIPLLEALVALAGITGSRAAGPAGGSGNDQIDTTVWGLRRMLKDPRTDRYPARSTVQGWLRRLLERDCIDCLVVKTKSGQCLGLRITLRPRVLTPAQRKARSTQYYRPPIPLPIPIHTSIDRGYETSGTKYFTSPLMTPVLDEVVGPVENGNSGDNLDNPLTEQDKVALRSYLGNLQPPDG